MDEISRGLLPETTGYDVKYFVMTGNLPVPFRSLFPGILIIYENKILSVNPTFVRSKFTT
jgi:hypothetical protein